MKYTSREHSANFKTQVVLVRWSTLFGLTQPKLKNGTASYVCLSCYQDFVDYLRTLDNWFQIRKITHLKFHPLRKVGKMLSDLNYSKLSKDL